MPPAHIRPLVEGLRLPGVTTAMARAISKEAMDVALVTFIRAPFDARNLREALAMRYAAGFDFFIADIAASRVQQLTTASGASHGKI